MIAMAYHVAAVCVHGPDFSQEDYPIYCCIWKGADIEINAAKARDDGHVLVSMRHGLSLTM